MNEAHTLDASAQESKKPIRLKRSSVIWLAVTAAMVCVLFALAFMTPRSIDDYYYATFWNDGFSGFLRNMASHYQEMNGRTFVHTVAALVLKAGTVCFGAVSVALAVAMPLLGHKMISPNASPWPTLAVFMGGLLLTPQPMMVEGVLWQSAYFNYVFPTAMMVILLYLLRRLTAGETLKPAVAVGLMVYAFLCGATTEQSGALAVCVILAVAAECLLTNRKRLWLPLLFLLACVGGGCTIFFSPATRSRVQQESIGLSWPILYRGLRTQSSLMKHYAVLLVLLGLLFLVLAVFCAVRLDGRLSGVLVFLLPLPALLGVFLSPAETRPFFYLALLAILAGVGVFFWLKKERPLGTLLALSSGSLLVIAVTLSNAARTVTPFYLYTLTALACVLGGFCAGKQKWLGYVGAAVVVVSGIVNIGYHMPHYVHNYTVEHRNHAAERQARATNVLWYDIDYDTGYVGGQPYSSSFCLQYYRPSAGLDEACQVYFYGKGLPRIFLDDQMLDLPVAFGEAGEVLIPLREIIEGFGGTVDWTPEITTIRLDGKESLLFFNGPTLSLSGTDSNGDPITMSTPYNKKYYTTILPLEFYQRFYSIRITQDDGGFHVSR